MNIGFTGTQAEPTPAQKDALRIVLKLLLHEDAWFHSGDCVGADRVAHDIAAELGYSTHGHPPINDSKRAHCEYDVSEEPLGYIERNHAIVDSSTFLIAVPKTFSEETRSGTWATVRYARKKNVQILKIWPDGKLEKEG